MNEIIRKKILGKIQNTLSQTGELDKKGNVIEIHSKQIISELCLTEGITKNRAQEYLDVFVDAGKMEIDEEGYIWWKK